MGYNPLLPIFLESQGNFTRGVRAMSEDDYFSDTYVPTVPPGKKPVETIKKPAEPQSSKPSSSHRIAPQSKVTNALLQGELPESTGIEHIDLTQAEHDSDGDSSDTSDQPIRSLETRATTLGTTNTVEVATDTPTEGMNVATPTANDDAVDNTPLPDTHEVKLIKAARREFHSNRPPFVRKFKNEGPKIVMLAADNGELAYPEVLAALVNRKWDSVYSFYTIDRNGERLIVKPSGKRLIRGTQGGTQYRPWSGRGNMYETVPVAFSFNDHNGEQPGAREEVEEDLGSSLRDIALQDSERNGLGSATNTDTPKLHPSQAESSSNAAQISEVAAGKRPARDAIDNDRSSKRIHSVGSNSLTKSSTNVRVPPTLSLYKQERTTLLVMLPGSPPLAVPVKLQSAMTMDTLFSSVSAAVGFGKHQDVAIAGLLGSEDGGPPMSIVVKRDMKDTFETLLEYVDEAQCWKKEGGRMALKVHLMMKRWQPI